MLKEVSDIELHADKYESRRGNWSFPYPYDYNFTGDFLIHDFTLAELKELRKIERYKSRNHHLDGIFSYVTLEEAIELVLDMNKKFPHHGSKTFPTGLYIETKMYEFYK